jgi:hypothetical protein
MKMRCGVITAVTVKITVFWDVGPCSLVAGAEMFPPYYQVIWHHIPEGSNP